MTRKLFLGMAALIALTAMTTARADEPSDVAQVSTMNIATQYASMQAELDELRARFDQVSFGGEAGCDDCGQGKCDGCGASCGCNCYCNIGCGGIYGGAEAVVVRPHFSHEIDSVPGFDNGWLSQVDPRFNYAVSPRIFLGWRNCRGTGVRARYWLFDQTAKLRSDNIPGALFTSALDSTLNVQALDLEFTQLVCWGPLQSNFAFGVRYGSVENELKSLGGVPGNYELYAKLRTQFDGWGPTIAMENRIPLGCSNLAVVGNLRGSLLFGDMHYTQWGNVGAAPAENGGEQTVTKGQDDVVAVAEIQVGLQWQRCTGFGVLSAYALLEGQWWTGAVSNLTWDAYHFNGHGGGHDFSTDQDLGFVGGTFGVQLAR